MKINDIDSLIKPGLFYLINEQDKKIDIHYSSNVLFAVQEIISQIKKRTFSDKKLQTDYLNQKIDFSFIEETNDKILQKIRHTYWCKHYESLGYTLYRKRYAIEYKVKTYIKGLLGSYYFLVGLKDKNNKVTIVGVFDRDKDRKKFLDRYYTDQEFNVVYSLNKFTKAYVTALQKYPDEDPLKYV